MKQSYWQQHYVLETDADEIERYLQRTTFLSGGKQFELMYFEADKKAPSILISPGSGPGHVFTELAYRIHLNAYNVFMMPNNGGSTIRELMPLTRSPWSPYVGRPSEPRSLRTAADRPRPSHDMTMSQPGTVNQSMQACLKERWLRGCR